jgi:hypothetical protein
MADPYVELFNIEQFAGINIAESYYQFYLSAIRRDPFYATDRFLIPYLFTPIQFKAEIHNHSNPIGWKVEVYNGNAKIYAFINESATFFFQITPRKGPNKIYLVLYDQTNKQFETIPVFFEAVDYLMPSFPFINEMVKNRIHIEKLLNYSITNEKLNSVEIEETWGKLGARFDSNRSDSLDSELSYRLRVRTYLQGIYEKKDKNDGLKDVLYSIFGINPIIVNHQDIRFPISVVGNIGSATKWANDDYGSFGSGAIGQMVLRDETIINNGFDVIVWGEKDVDVIRNKIDQISPIYTEYGIKLGSDYISYALSSPTDEKFTFEKGFLYIDRFNIVNKKNELSPSVITVIEETIPFEIGEKVKLGSQEYTVKFIDTNDKEIGFEENILETVDGLKIGSAEEAIYETDILPIPDESIYYGDLFLYKFNTAEVNLYLKRAKSTSEMLSVSYTPFNINELVSYGMVDDLIDMETTGPIWQTGRTYNFASPAGKYIYRELSEPLHIDGIESFKLTVTSSLPGTNLLFFGLGTRLWSNYQDIEYLVPINLSGTTSEDKVFDVSDIDAKIINNIRYIYIIQGTSGSVFVATFSKLTTDKTCSFFKLKATVKNVTQKYDFAMGDFILKKI